MVDKIVVTIADLTIKYRRKPAFKGFYSLAKHTFPDDGNKATESFDR